LNLGRLQRSPGIAERQRSKAAVQDLVPFAAKLPVHRTARHPRSRCRGCCGRTSLPTTPRAWAAVSSTRRSLRAPDSIDALPQLLLLPAPGVAQEPLAALKDYGGAGLAWRSTATALPSELVPCCAHFQPVLRLTAQHTQPNANRAPLASRIVGKSAPMSIRKKLWMVRPRGLPQRHHRG
jgi:hypothetical protein